MYTTKTDVMSTISKNLRAAKEAHERYTEKSWNAAVANRRYGQPIPKKGVFYDDDNRLAFNSELDALRRDTELTISEYEKGLSKLSATEPSEEAVRAVQMFSMMDPGTMNREEYGKRINDMIAEYGDNSLTYDTLRSLAVKNGVVSIAKNPTMEAREALESVKTSVHSFFARNTALNNEKEVGLSAGAISWMEMRMNDALGIIGDNNTV